MSTSISNAVQRLNSQLPLKLRQAALPPALANVHRTTLASLASQGRPPGREELQDYLLATTLMPPSPGWQMMTCWY
jgi:hypothetical protein